MGVNQDQTYYAGEENIARPWQDQASYMPPPHSPPDRVHLRPRQQRGHLPHQLSGDLPAPQPLHQLPPADVEVRD